MKLGGRLRGWRRRQRRKKAARARKSPLREFVYLDDVSVYSLIASRLGSVAAEFTDTETATLQGELTSSVGAGVGIAKGEIASRTEDTRTQASQVLRKSIVQTTFKELYELEENVLVMRPLGTDLEPPKIHNIAALEAGASSAELHGWIVSADRLARGQLLEVEIELEAEAIFRLSAVLTSVLEIMQENLELFQVDNYGELVQARSVNRVIEKLLVGLIPIRGRMVDFDAVEINGKVWLIHRKILSQLDERDRPPSQPIFLVGVAEHSLFWKDIRRILFSNSRFSVFCRLAKSGLQSSWTPVKLVDVLSAVVPDLAAQVDIAGRGLLATLGHNSNDASAERSRHAMSSALVGYATSLAKHFGKSLTEEDLAQNGSCRVPSNVTPSAP